MVQSHPPIVLQKTREQFEAAITKEFTEGSAISPELFYEAVEFVSDIETAVGQEPREAIAEFLNWELKSTQAGFSSRKSSFAALLHNEDRSPWQAKLNYQTWDSKKEKYPKPYYSPKKDPSEENRSRAYLPPVPASIRARISEKYNVKFPSEGSFWDFVIAHPEIPIVLTEGGKKALSALGTGTVTIAFYGVNAGYRKLKDGIYDLIDDLKPFCSEGRQFILAFDRDSNPETIKKVSNAVRRMDSLLQSECDGVSVKIAMWTPEQGKGIDDFIVSQGVEAWEQVLKNAEALPKQAVWDCLKSHNYQIGEWESLEVPEFSLDRIEQLKARCVWNPNIKYSGTKLDISGGKPVEMHVFSIFKPNCDFDFKVVKRLSSSDGGGLMLQVSRLQCSEVQTKDVFIKSSETTQVKDFANALKRELGFNVSIALNGNQLAALLQNRTATYEKRGGKTYRLADRVGKQDDGTWVFENCQFKADGTPTSESESLWVFNHSLGETEQIPSPLIAEQNPDALKKLVDGCKVFFHPEALGKVLFTCGYAAATLRHQEIMRAEHRFPQLSLFGERGGAKTTAALAAASLAGMHLSKFVVSKFSESLIYEQVKLLGCLPLLIDDPIKKGAKKEARNAIDNFLWSAYNGTTRKVRGNAQTPHTAVMVTSNVALGEDNAAAESRLLKPVFDVLPCNESAYPELEAAMNQASGGFSQLAGIQYDREAVRELNQKLLEFLPSAHCRVAWSLALVTYFTQKFVDLAGHEFDAFEFCKERLCPQMDQYESGKDSLTDFLEKLSLMKADGEIGRWNCVTVKLRRDDKQYAAIDLASVWGRFEQRFSPNYSRQGLNALIQAAGGHTNEKQKFVPTKLECTEYLKEIAEFKRKSEREQAESFPPLEPKKSQLRNCVLIPIALLPNQEDENEVTTDSSNSQPESSDTAKPEEPTKSTEVATESKIEHPTAPEPVATEPPLPDGWTPKKDDRVWTLDFATWKPATVLEIPGEKPRWKVRIDGVKNPVLLYEVSCMRPLNVVEAIA